MSAHLLSSKAFCQCGIPPVASAQPRAQFAMLLAPYRPWVRVATPSMSHSETISCGRETGLSEKCGPPGVVLGAKTRFAPELVPVGSSRSEEHTGFGTVRGAGG